VYLKQGYSFYLRLGLGIFATKKDLNPQKGTKVESAVPPSLTEKFRPLELVNAKLRRIFPTELKRWVQKDLPRLASTAYFLWARVLFYYSLSLFLSAIIINRKEMFCQGGVGEIYCFTFFSQTFV